MSKFAADSLAKARRELALVTGDFLEAGTVADDEEPFVLITRDRPWERRG